VLVHGGAGAVGVFAIQLAHLHKAHVTTTVSARNVGFIKGLGADRAIDYRTAQFDEEARDFDVVFATVGGDTLRRSWNALKPNGRLVTIAASGETALDARTKEALFIVAPSRKQLIEIGQLLDAGDLQPVVDREVALSQVSEAYTGAIERKGREKLLTVVA
jgi:NADPH:quinone reductase-like Zn-dependent oxidoreductase